MTDPRPTPPENSLKEARDESALKKKVAPRPPPPGVDAARLEGALQTIAELERENAVMRVRLQRIAGMDGTAARVAAETLDHIDAMRAAEERP